jgi:CheY-like chemotaxis protein
MAVGGRLAIETANVTVTEVPIRHEFPAPGEYAMIAVSDNGTGMTPGVLARVFEPFFTTKEVGKGSGLGLAQVFGFVKQSGGGIRIDTVVGEGTSIKVYLPRAEPGEDLVAASDADAAQVHRAGNAPTLLVVDDDGGVREVSATRLSEAGYQVREAASGLQALAALEADPFVDLVVIDFAMPGMNGAQTAAEIRKRWPGIPLLFVTGFADTTALTQAGAAGADAIVQKPFRVGELERKVSAALATRPGGGLRLVSDRTRGS